MGSSKKATAANFADQVQRILDEYGDDVRDNVEEITKAVSKKAVKELKGASGIFGGSGKYARGWTVTNEKTRLGFTAVIHHKTQPGLPHLLEHGHVLVSNGRRAGRVAGREHIAPVEEKTIELYEREVVSKL